MTLYTSYDPFAWTYNKHWGDTFLPVILPILDNLVLCKLRRGARILDVCCGTGQLDARLTALGYRVTGIDGSSEMLRHAQANAPKGEFIQADARTFTLPRKYPAAISVFDSLNHVMTLHELAQVFNRVHDALQPDGLFLFDLNTPAGYMREWQGDYSIVEEDHVCVQRISYSMSRRVALFDSTVFRFRDGYWYRADVKIYEKCHGIGQVKGALRKAGFTGVEVFGFDLQSGITPLAKDMRRAFFFCRRA